MPKNLKSENGLALVITLLITSILVALITEIVYAVHIHLSMSGLYKDSQRAGLFAEGGVELAKKGLEEIIKDKSYTILDERNSRINFAEGDGGLSISVFDEHAKVNLNSIVYPNGEINAEQYAVYSRLLKMLRLDAELADALADWIDINDEPRQGGGETYDYYQRLKPAYKAKNNYLDSNAEILLIKGYDMDVYKRLLPFVTVYADSRININNAPKEVIMALNNEITDEMAQRVIDYRKKEPFKDTSDIRKVSGFETVGFAIQNRITVKSSVFTVSAKAVVNDASREVEAVVDAAQNNRVRFWRQM